VLSGLPLDIERVAILCDIDRSGLHSEHASPLCRPLYAAAKGNT
jgi:hypothetical protein